MTKVFETERLVVRRFEPEDVNALVELGRHPSVSSEIPEIPWQDPAKLVDYIDEQAALELFAAQTGVDLAIVRKSDGRIIGLICLVSNGARQAKIGWILGIDHRSRGCATEAARGLIEYAFRVCDFHRVSADTTSSNERSRKLMERLGMRQEAYLREADPPDEPGGRWADIVSYAVLASEWPTAEKPQPRSALGNG